MTKSCYWQKDLNISWEILKPRVHPNQLCHLDNSLRSINLTVEPLAPGPDLDNCLVRQLEKQVGRLWAELMDFTRGILLLEQEDQNLFDQESTLKKALFDLSLRIEHLLIRLPLHQPTELKVASNWLRLMYSVSAHGSMMKARALLVSACSTSFITESLARRLHLCWRHSMKVSGIGGSSTRLSLRGMVDLNISNHCGKTLAVEVVVLSKVTTTLPSCPVTFNWKCKHLSNIRLASADFGTTQECWSAPRNRRLQPYNASQSAV